MNLFKSFSIALLSSLLLFFTSCEVDQETLNETTREQQDIPKDIIQKLEKAGFHTHEGLSKVEDGYVVEYDIFLTEEEIYELANQNIENNSKHYRTNNLVSGTRTIRVYVDPALGSFVRSATDQALQRYNAQNLRLTFSRTTNASSNDIRIMAASNTALDGSFASAGFPKNGRPHNLIRMNTSFYGGSNRLGNTVTVIAHEIGHCIGFRHTDYANRAFSGCPGGGNEGQGEYGAIHIPGTPTTFAVANSWMLACIGREVNRPFIASDRTALQRLYARTPPPVSPVPFYRFYNSSRVNHYYSTSRSTPGGYRYEGVQCKIYNQQVPGTVPLYRFYNSSAVNHFYQQSRSTPAGYRYEGVAGYVFRSGGNGRIPLYRYYNSSAVNHFYTTNRSEGNNAAGYTYEGVAGYVLR
ncbi:M57 family metalloprotease [Aquimarina gracilis]|uniref:M57 family metalloprotease n=1 Tax=Aquimarina gracilis TaxID=874422 RepID=A0ABU6A1F6_9FLAO|nr:M57 family metalloprotease [Aquimarina gracilis]MEB3347995.1 M57 family metalloprotease [Aquimarina gracilis]